MLEHRDNIDYTTDTEPNLDSELLELAEVIYKQVRKRVLREIKYKELAATVVLRDLQEMRDRSPKHYAVVEEWVVHNDYSYAQIAEVFGVSAQRIHTIIQLEAKQYAWIANLAKIKSAEDAKNENNKTVFFHPRKRPNVFHPSEQGNLFE